MVEVAVVGWVGYVLVAFVLRTLVHLRQTGTTGFVGLRRGAGLLERGAGVAMVLAFVLSLIAPWVGRPLVASTWLGATLLVLATVGTLVAQRSMARSWRIGVEVAERTELVTRGPFAWVRNPIFSCMILASLGLALACPTPLALLAPVLLIAALEVQVRVVEEPYLRAVHGDRYRDYARSTGRFVPGIGCWSGGE